MSNVIDFAEAKRKKSTIQEPILPTSAAIDTTKRIEKSINKVNLFHKEVRRIKFLNMPPPGMFVVVNTANLPGCFPPDPPPDPPPLVA